MRSMKRRELLKRVLAAPFLGALAGAKVFEPVVSEELASGPVVGNVPFSGVSHMTGVGPIELFELYIREVKVCGVAHVELMGGNGWGPMYFSLKISTPSRIYNDWLSGEPERVPVKLIDVNTGRTYDFEAICYSEVINGGTDYERSRFDYEYRSI